MPSEVDQGLCTVLAIPRPRKAKDIAARLVIQTVQPSEQSVVVVGSGVADAVVLLVKRKIDALLSLYESELQYVHARIPRLSQQLVHIVGDDAEIFGKNRKVTVDFVQAVKQVHAGPRKPLAVSRRLFSGWHGPGAGERTKMRKEQVCSFSCVEIC